MILIWSFEEFLYINFSYVCSSAPKKSNKLKNKINKINKINNTATCRRKQTKSENTKMNQQSQGKKMKWAQKMSKKQQNANKNFIKKKTNWTNNFEQKKKQYTIHSDTNIIIILNKNIYTSQHTIYDFFGKNISLLHSKKIKKLSIKNWMYLTYFLLLLISIIIIRIMILLAL